MFAPYNLMVSNDEKKEFIYKCDTQSIQSFEKYENSLTKIIEDKISYFDSEKNILDGSKLQEDWFPSLDFNIFISHSHKDHSLAVALANFIESRTSLKVFVDGMVWKNADELQHKLDDKFSLIDTNLYSYKKVLATTSNVNAILSMAIMKVMDKTDVVLLLNTNNSVLAFDSLADKTLSPWLFEEWLFTQNLKRTKHTRKISKTATLETKNMQVAYELPDINNYKKLRIKDIENWIYKCDSKKYSYDKLEQLYEMFKPYREETKPLLE